MAQAYVYEDDATGWRTFQNGDLPNSGVTAATYGDATHVAQVAVNAQGIVTGASNVAISAGSGITTLASPNSTITVTNPTGPTADVDLPHTGISASTFGDAQHVAQVTTDLEGRITAISNVTIAGAGGGGFGLVKLFESTLGADAASIDTGVNGIAAGHGDLTLFYYGRNSSVATNNNVTIQFNGDTGANYDFSGWRTLSGAGTSPTQVAGTSGVLSVAPAASHNANYVGIAHAAIPMYGVTTTWWKVMETVTGYGDNATAQYQVLTLMNTWRSTAAINQITVKESGGNNLLSGSRLVIYGSQ